MVLKHVPKWLRSWSHVAWLIQQFFTICCDHTSILLLLQHAFCNRPGNSHAETLFRSDCFNSHIFSWLCIIYFFKWSFLSLLLCGGRVKSDGVTRWLWRFCSKTLGECCFTTCFYKTSAMTYIYIYMFIQTIEPRNTYSNQNTVKNFIKKLPRKLLKRFILALKTFFGLFHTPAAQ